jgi:hypothetical protein
MDNVTLLARVLAMQAEMYQIITVVEGMKALNQWREGRGEGQAYGEGAFCAKADLLLGISQRIVTVARG